MEIAPGVGRARRELPRDACCGFSSRTPSQQRISRASGCAHLGIEASIGASSWARSTEPATRSWNGPVLIKVMLGASADRLERFSREAQVLASLDRPHIAQIHGLEAPAYEPWSWNWSRARRSPIGSASAAIPVGEALSIAAQIAEALEAAHKQEIIHREPEARERGDIAARTAR